MVLNQKPRKIFLIDDDETSNFVSKIIIQAMDESIIVEVLNNGQEAIDHFSKTDDPPDLVLLDINMPFINGFEFLDYYADQNWNGRTKFAIYSTSSRESDKRKSMSYEQVIGYIEKPLNEAKLKDLLQKFSGQ